MSQNYLWDTTKRLSYDSTFSVIPQVIAVGDTVHVMWVGWGSNSLSDSGWGINYSRSTNGGETFSPARVIVPFNDVNKYPQLVVHERFVYVFYLATVDSPVYLSSAMIRSTDAGATWEQRKVIKDYDVWCIATQDSHIYIHGGAVYSNKYYNTMMTSSDNGVTWDTSWISLFGGPNVARLGFTKNALHLVRSIGQNGVRDIYFNKSTDKGKTWSKEKVLSTIDLWESQNPRIATSDSCVYVIWNEMKYGGIFSGTIVLRKSTDEGNTWSDEEIISQKETAIWGDISAKGSRCAIVWNSDEGGIGSFRIRTSNNEGVTFSPASTISEDDRFPDDPSVFIDDNNIHTVWWDHVDTDVYYRKAHISPVFVQSHNALTAQYQLLYNYPNPFNPTTTINYDLPKSGMTTLKVYNALGQEIATLVNATQEPGRYSVNFDGSRLSSGMYIYKLTSGSFSQTKRMMLVK